MKIALIQYNPAWENKETNKQKILSMISKVEESRAVCFSRNDSYRIYNEGERNV